ncbi:unnamed protein product [Blepharisma stoltei]|uniref:Uncharacterized protein n=1 Tax=Blepharisma stoltei TaxID=1481888 RepID=A0AAU9IUY9_9CILI|nr:unnamed protein product [Blepharisma stoltei]
MAFDKGHPLQAIKNLILYKIPFVYFWNLDKMKEIIRQRFIMHEIALRNMWIGWKIKVKRKRKLAIW